MSQPGMSEFLSPNGIDAVSGDYLFEQVSLADVCRVARGQPLGEHEKAQIKQRVLLDAQQKAGDYGTIYGINPYDLSSAGWGVVFPGQLEKKRLEALLEALDPLLKLRQEQASGGDLPRFRIFSGEAGFQPGDTKESFLRRHGRQQGPADPQYVPYYLLLVADPCQIPFTAQYQLDIQYAVGRIHFDRLEDYAIYARSVAEAESGKLALRRRAAFFGVSNPDDRPTAISTEYLVKPLAKLTQSQQASWNVEQYTHEQAHKKELAYLLHCGEPPALLFTASHGISFPPGHPLQLEFQGALLCQDWPGKKQHRGPLTRDHYFSAEDIASDADVFGMLGFFFACYGAGTPPIDNFSNKLVAPEAFSARLPQKLLCHPRGGALAVIGHVDRAWGCSFYWDGFGNDLATFKSTLDCLIDGQPIGSALEPFNSRYAEVAAGLTDELASTTPDIQNEVKIAGLWTSNHDARNYAILGDPAVRMMTAAGDSDGAAEAAACQARQRRPKIEINRVTLIDPEPAAIDQPVDKDHSKRKKGASPEKASVAFDASQDSPFPPAITPQILEFMERVNAVLQQALSQGSTLEVATYITSPDPGEVAATGLPAGLPASQDRGELFALTRISLSGNTDVFLPKREQGEIDSALWQIHLESVRQAQAGRTEMLRTIFVAFTQLGGSIKAPEA